MKGMIVLWSGAIVDIPHGWQICNGTNGTPDLRNKFVIGAGDTYDPDDTGGATEHNHYFNDWGHTHTIGGGSGINTGTDKSTTTEPIEATGTTGNGSNLPPYFALAFIMKL